MARSFLILGTIILHAGCGLERKNMNPRPEQLFNHAKPVRGR